VKKWIIVYGSMLLLVLLSCSGSSPVAGGTTDTGNARVVCSVVDARGTPVSGAEVRIRPVDYVAAGALSHQADGRTDARGGVTLDASVAGRYSIEISDGDSSAVLLQVWVDDTARVVVVPTATLRPFAVVRGSVGGGAPGSPRRGGYVQVYGLERLVELDSNGVFAFDDLPQGVYTMRAVVQGAETKLVQMDSVQALAGDTIEAHDYAIWQASRPLYLNTSPTGAYLSVPVDDFPLLVRLDATTFDFAQAQSGGQDIRFTDHDGVPLAYDIELWDSLHARAALWVRIPQVQPDNDRQFIQMFWGNRKALSAAAAAQVFDTANGFVAVWHLGDYSDRSLHAAHLAPALQPAFVDGVVGSGYGFDGVDDTLCAGAHPALAVDAKMTVSMWVQFAPSDSARNMRLISKKDEIWQPGGYALEVVADSQDSSGVRLYGNNANFAATGPRSWYSERWYYLVAVYDETQARFYVDGVLLGAADSTLLPLSADNEKLYLGGWEQSFFKGRLDEVRIARVVRSAHWIALSYQNQRAAQRLVEFR
jgi:hypothetical protein